MHYIFPEQAMLRIPFKIQIQMITEMLPIEKQQQHLLIH